MPEFKIENEIRISCAKVEANTLWHFQNVKREVYALYCDSTILRHDLVVIQYCRNIVHFANDIATVLCFDKRSDPDSKKACGRARYPRETRYMIGAALMQ